MSLPGRGWSIPLLVERTLLARMRSNEQGHLQPLTGEKRTNALSACTAEQRADSCAYVRQQQSCADIGIIQCGVQLKYGAWLGSNRG
jgi:hypothetical protein